MNFKAFDDSFNKNLSFLQNQYVSAAIYLFLILFASLVAPKLPESVTKYLDIDRHPILGSVLRLLAFFLILYLYKFDASVSLIVAIAMLVVLQTLSRHKINSYMLNSLDKDIGMNKYENMTSSYIYDNDE